MTIASTAAFAQRKPELLGQTVVVVGGSAGIGLETARRARVEGAHLILTGRHPERLQRAALELEERQLLEDHPDYTAGYFMAAQTLAKAERSDEAKIRLSQGIASARRTGNQHALSEMQAMLDELELAG